MVLIRSALWYTPVAGPGGVARHILDATAQGVPGWRLVVLCPEGPLATQLREQGVPVITGAVSPQDGTRRALGAVRWALDRLRPDVLHTHLAFADLVGVAAVRGARSGAGARVRLVSTEHGISGVPGLYQRSAAAARGKALAHRARLHGTDRVIAVSRSTRDQVRAQWGRGAPITVIPNAVKVPSSSPAPQPGLRILSLSRLAPEKRIDALIDAVALVRAEHPQARLTIAGEGPERAALRQRIRDRGLEAAVTMPGHLPAEQALAAHDVLAQLSTWENLSYSLLDAVARGLGTVATDVGGTAEILPRRCLVDASDPAAVAATIIAQGTDLAARPQRPADAGGPADMTAAIGQVYREVIA